MSIMQKYEDAIAAGDISDDPLQRQVIPHLQEIANALNIKSRFWFRRSKLPVQGLYLYGPVGAGKTYLIDLFYNAVEESHKARFHFHHFMQQIDAQLRRLQGLKNPLRQIAKDLAKRARLICLDECLVNDVADAMILAELLRALFSYNVVLVVTSNTRPDDLYLNGVHRDRFLAAIEIIKAHCHVVVLADHQDYRLGRTPLLHAYISPLTPANERLFDQQFKAIAINPRDEHQIEIQKRMIACVNCSDRAVWFKFNIICNLPRSQLDYLEIADRFDTVFVSDIPAISSEQSVFVLLLIHFVDVMYDRGVRLILSAAVSLDQIYVKGTMLKEFKRTRSRLEEMQSVDYLKRHPRRRIVLI